MIKVLDLEKNVESLHASILRQRIGEREKSLVEAAPALLRLARAAKAASDVTFGCSEPYQMPTEEDEELLGALAAFDFKEKP